MQESFAAQAAEYTNKQHLPLTSMVYEVKGHQLVVETLQKAFEHQRLHHAYMFHGPTGVGKRKVAFLMARLLLCTQPLLNSITQQACHACGHCKSCLRVTPFIEGKEGTYHPDLHHITRELDSLGKRAKEIKIAPIRELQSALSLGSFEGGRVVVFIEEVDRLGLSAANALLKTLEEPLADVHFILSTSSLNAVLPTIKSRAQSLRFAPLSPQVLVELLAQFEMKEQTQIALSEAPTYAPLNEVQRLSLAQLSGGSIGRALELWSQGGMAKVEQLIQASDLNGGPQDLLNALAYSKSLETASEAELSQWIHILRCWYRDALVLLHHPQEKQLFFPNLKEFSAQRGTRLGLERLMWRLNALDECEQHLFRRVGSNRKLIVETLCLYLAGFDALTQKPLRLS